MTDNSLPAFHSLCLPAEPTVPPLDALLLRSGMAFMGVFNPGGGARDADSLRTMIARAERLVTDAAVMAVQLQEAAEPESVEEIGQQLRQFGYAWPNASKADLAGYGVQLLEDIADRRPCRYALRSALPHLRQTSRWLPSIAEVLSALDDATDRIRNTAFHLQEMPALLARARADLATAETRNRRPLPDASEDVR